MNKWYKWGLLWYGITLLLALIVIFGLGREFNPITNITQTIFTADGINQFRKGMDVAWWVKLTYKVDFSKYAAIYPILSEQDIAKRDAIGIIIKNIDKRISGLGVSDYTVRQQLIDDETFIVIEIGGVYSVEAAKEIIGRTVELDFKIPTPTDKKSEFATQRVGLKNELFWQIKANPDDLTNLVVGREKDDVYVRSFSGTNIASLPTFYQETLADLKAWSIKDFGLVEYIPADASQGTEALNGYILTIVDEINTEIQTDEDGNETSITTITGREVFVSEAPQWIIAIDDKNNILDGAYFAYATPGINQIGKPVVTINFNDQGKDIFCNLTKIHVNKQMAIFVGGELMTAPVINEPICGGSAQIDGNFTSASARELSDNLNEGALPAPLIISQEEKVSPALWEQAITGALLAGAIGLVLMLIFLVYVYGYKIGFVGFAVLVSYVIYLLAAFKIIDYAFSLSGIAAIILSLGMGIDANILIFERLKEELNSGKSFSSAVETAYTRSREAIRDGNVTTILVFLVLFGMGMSIFKWFGFAGLISWGLILLVNVPLTKKLLKLIKKQ